MKKKSSALDACMPLVLEGGLDASFSAIRRGEINMLTFRVFRKYVGDTKNVVFMYVNTTSSATTPPCSHHYAVCQRSQPKKALAGGHGAPGVYRAWASILLAPTAKRGELFAELCEGFLSSFSTLLEAEFGALCVCSCKVYSMSE